MLSKQYWARVFERAIKTAAQSALLAVGADQVNALQLDFVTVGGFAAGGFLLSVLTSLASAAVGDSEDPSLV